MRISLLLDREPFGDILEQTLSRYWHHRFARRFQVCWDQFRSRPPHHRSPAQQWLCNTYLNAIFTPHIDSRALDPIRHEFTRSLQAWKRPWQRTYVQAATGQGTASWLAQARLWVTPAVPDGENILIVPGNRKIRLLNYVEGTCVAVQKNGSSPIWLRTEVAARRHAADLGLPVPELLSHDLDTGWFAESYICGTPLNRLPPGTRRDRATAHAVSAIARLAEATRQDELTEDYLTRLQQQTDEDLHALAERTATSDEPLAELARRLHRHVRCCRWPRHLTTALTHGDLQPANVLESQQCTWLIDWERFSRRQYGYDGLTFITAARFPQGLARRLDRFVKCELSRPPVIAGTTWPGTRFAAEHERQRHAALFLCEELAWHLQENTERALSGKTPGLVLIQHEIAQWLDKHTRPR